VVNKGRIIQQLLSVILQAPMYLQCLCISYLLQNQEQLLPSLQCRMTTTRCLNAANRNIGIRRSGYLTSNRNIGIRRSGDLTYNQ